MRPLLAICSALFVAIVFAACDVLEHDASPVKPSIEIKDNEFHILSNGTAYIDLHSMVKTNGKINFNVSSQPNKGDLSEAAKGLLRYAPNNNFERGRDSFTLSVFDEGGGLLLTDTVVIVVEDDSTNMPCGYFAVDDYVFSSSSTVTINVLQNDWLCGDSSNIKLEIYRPDNSFPPHSGTASVVANHILYQGTSDVLSDSIIYKVSNIADNSLVGYAMVHININGNCTPTAFEDYYVHDNLNKLTDTLDLYVLRNDSFCGNSINSLSVITAPHHGDAFLAQSDSAMYIKYAYEMPAEDSTTHFSDSLRYQFCIGSNCYSGKARIDIH
jgi:hypothetical protein